MKKKISVYHYRYLPLSETFIYRQLQGLSGFFDLQLFTHGVENKEEFPGFEPLVLRPRNIWRKLLRDEERFFEKHLQGSSLFHVNFGHIAIGMQRHAVRAGIPMTAYFLGVDASACLKSSIYRYRLRRSRFEAVFVNSEDMKRRLIPYLPSDMKCYVAYCGIPLERFPFKLRHSVPEGATFLQVSRLDSKKGVDITLKAFSRYIREFDPKARLIIGGDGPLEKDLLHLAASLGLNENVSFLGYIGYKKYIELLHTVDAFVHPSVTSEDGDMEGIPTSICEAMACGLPVISTWHSGIPEAIDDGESGFLVQERDAEGLCNSMISLRAADIGRISKSARKKIEVRFDHEKTISILADFMSDIMSGGKCEL